MRGRNQFIRVHNMSLNRLRLLLKTAGCKHIRSKGGHEIWSKKGLSRPIVIQSHINPVPSFVVNNIIKTLGLTGEEFFQIAAKKK